ncbi:MAG TPA: hypothetical protein PK847_04280 [Candidatus Sumerlaeota bacterium]|nr:hypothetical protein [Candidatus Sumerlaeota bacterium]
MPTPVPNSLVAGAPNAQPASDRAADAPAPETIDPAAAAGFLVAAAAIIVTLFGILIPLVTWLLAAGLGLITIGCGLFARRPYRRWILLAGAVALIPASILLLVQLLPHYRF